MPRKMLYYIVVAFLGVCTVIAGDVIYGSGGNLNNVGNWRHLDIYYFYSDTCPHCQEVKPYIMNLSKRYNITFCNVKSLDEECLKIARELEVKYTPTIVVKNKGTSIFVGSNEVIKFTKTLGG